MKYSGNTVEDYKIAVKRFFRWVLANDAHIPDVVKWIKKRKAINRNVKPRNMITEKEMGKIMDACKNPGIEPDKDIEEALNIGEKTLYRLMSKNVSNDNTDKKSGRSKKTSMEDDDK